MFDRDIQLASAQFRVRISINVCYCSNTSTHSSSADAACASFYCALFIPRASSLPLGHCPRIPFFAASSSLRPRVLRARALGLQRASPAQVRLPLTVSASFFNSVSQHPRAAECSPWRSLLPAAWACFWQDASGLRAASRCACRADTVDRRHGQLPSRPHEARPVEGLRGSVRGQW